MKCERIKELIPGYITGNLDSKTKMQIDSHISECAGCKQELENVNLVWSKLAQIPMEEPGPEVRSRFYSMLKSYRHGLDYAPAKLPWNEKLGKWLGQRWFRRPVFQFGFAVILIIFGIIIGQRINYGVHTNGEIAELKDEVREMREMITNSLLNQSSAIERLQGLTMSRSLTDPDEEFLALLLVTLNSDPNVNVRLAAVDALHTFSDNSWVRTELARSLSRQTSPLVQISLIDLMVEIREQKVLEVLRAIIDDQQSIESVKKRARWGIQQII